MEESPLDNPIWHSLTGAHADLACGRGAVRHYPRDVASYSAIVDSSELALADFAEQPASDLQARLFRPRQEPAPHGWETTFAQPIEQMTLTVSRLPAMLPYEADVVRLDLSHTDEILKLVDLVRPGPFAPRTALLGRYVGIRDRGTGGLLGMAGERFCVPGHVELSAICVHPAARGLGMGAAMTAALARAALARGEAPFLHVYGQNPAAALYSRLGFQVRRLLWVLLWRRLPRPYSLSA